MARTTALIRECVPVEELVSIINDYLCPTPGTDLVIGLCGHGERCERGYSNNTAIWMGMCKSGNTSLIEAIVNKPSVSASDINDGLHYACHYGQIDIVNLLIGHDADDYAAGLAFASSSGHLDVAARMIECGADNLQGSLYLACNGRHTALAALLIKHGAKPEDCIACRGDRHA